MKACGVIEVITPKKFVLNGLWFGPRRPKRAIVWVHGLGSSAFRQLGIVERLVDKNTAVITFNNRGFGTINSVKRRIGNTSKSISVGTAHEIFTDSVDDIQGAIDFVRRAGVKNIYLAGHSTGCQKSIYWASKKGGRGVKGIILLAPISDYSTHIMLQGKRRVARATIVARALVRGGKKHEMLPAHIWYQEFDAQRFLSLSTPDSVEEIFSYAQPKKNPRILKTVKVPLLVLLGEKDEYGDRPAEGIAEWFKMHVQARKSDIRIIPGAPHSFADSEQRVATTMRRWIASL